MDTEPSAPFTSADCGLSSLLTSVDGPQGSFREAFSGVLTTSVYEPVDNQEHMVRHH
jgi:hypothetical protein